MKKKIGALLLTLTLSFSFTTTALAKGEPSIAGKSAVTLDAETGEIIYAKDIDAKSYPASITKLMSALLLAQNKQKNDQLKYTENAKKQPEYSVNLNLAPIAVGETMSADNVMDALLLFSGNDIAYMIADNVGGNPENFSKMMNDEAKKLHMKNSNFITPNGLHDQNHYTTAYDLTLLAREVIKNPWVMESCGKPTSKITTSKGTILLIENRNKLVGKNGCIGGKTGFTDEAGRCLLAFYERNGRKIVGAVMNSAYDVNDSAVFNDMESIINWSYDQKKVVVPELKKDTVVDTKTISYKPLKILGITKTINVPVIIKEDVTIYDNDVNKKDLKKDINISKLNPWNLKADTEIGTLTVSERESNKTYKLYTNITTKDLIKANTLLYIGAAVAALIAFSLVVFIILKIKNISRRRRRY